jgi:hypothetical protein
VKIDDSTSLLSLNGSLYMSASLFGFSSSYGSGGTCSVSSCSGGILDSFLLTEFNIIVLTVVLPEGGGINVHNSILDQSFSSDQLIISGVVDNIQ